MALKKVGALWEKEGKSKCWSGTINLDGVDTSILVFKNNYKKKSSHPDYTIHVREDDEEEAPQPEDDVPF